MSPITKIKQQVSLNDHLAHYMKSDKKFMDGIKKGVQACDEGRKKRWTQIKQELP